VAPVRGVKQTGLWTARLKPMPIPVFAMLWADGRGACGDTVFSLEALILRNVIK
jgi:hypothetical protein